MTRPIEVSLGEESYPIFLSDARDGWLKALAGLVASPSTVLITSPRVARHCLPLLKRELKKISIDPKIILAPDGEANKNLKTVSKIYDQMARLKIDRSATVILLGGGVIGDMGGFAAGTYLRGLSFIQIPTTLVGQIDSAIGGKLGIDLEAGKNLAGVFRQPRAVFCHIPFLKTLPAREMRGGLAEAVKYGVIEDPRLFDLLRRDAKKAARYDASRLEEIVLRSARIKACVVSEDENETKGLRMILNFGHTFGHALERLTRYRKYLHGEAVAIGMVIAARLSRRFGFCSASDLREVEGLLQNLGLPVRSPVFSRGDWVRALEIDKKARGGMIHFVWMKGIGQVAVKPMSPHVLVDAFLEEAGT